MLPLPRLLALALASALAVQLLAEPISRLSGADVLHVDSAIAQSGLPPVPARWPFTTLELGLSDSPGGASQMRMTAPYGFRYQYLAGGANTGNGWANWNSDGQFVTHYVQDSVNNGITPVFTYYMIAQSAPGGGSESDSVATNLQNTSTMTAYFNDLKLFFQRAGSVSQAVVLHVEPDMWGFMQQRAHGDAAATIPVQVSATGLPELAGLPNTAVGLAQALPRLRATYAPNVLLAYHVSVWGTGTDIQYADPPDSAVESLAIRAANFYLSLNTNFDLAFAEFSDRDAGFRQHVYGDGGASWWGAEDFRRHALFLSAFVSVSQKRAVLWQIPFGNTRMRAMNNTWNHYQDNRVEWLLDDATRTHLTEYLNAGVVAFLFGRGATGTTCACDAAGDGITDPGPVNGNVALSLNADDDGGFFRMQAGRYYSTGRMALPSGAAPPPTPTATPAPPSPTTTPRATPQPSFTSGAVAAPTALAPGGSVSLAASVTSATSSIVLVDLEIYDPSGAKVFQQWFESQSYAAGETKNYNVNWQLATTAANGTYVVKLGVFGSGWTPLHHWNNGAASFSVATGFPAATPSPTLPSGPTPLPTPSATLSSPNAPTNLRARAVSSTGIDITWTDNASSEGGFRIEQSTDGATFAEIATVAANVTSYASRQLSANTNYYYRVRAFNASGSSGYSNTARAKTPRR